MLIGKTYQRDQYPCQTRVSVVFSLCSKGIICSSCSQPDLRLAHTAFTNSKGFDETVSMSSVERLSLGLANFENQANILN